VADLVATPSGCTAACTANASCNAKAGSALAVSALPVANSSGYIGISHTANALNGTADLAWVYEALDEINYAVSTAELSVQGGIGASLNDLTQSAAVGAADFAGNSAQCFRFKLKDLGVGTL
jgi:hypothetical protein